MSAVDVGVKQGRDFHHTGLFERITREEYRKLGRIKAQQLYKSVEKQNEFMKGWFAISQPFFGLMADGPRWYLKSITLVCKRCGAEVEIDNEDGSELSQGTNWHMNHQYCPACQKEDCGLYD